jgi:hypothetical protein
VMSRSRAEVMSKPAQKMYKDTSSGKGMPRLIVKRLENLAHGRGTPSLISQMQEFHSTEKIWGIKERASDKSHLGAFPNHHLHFPRCGCTIAPPLCGERGNNFHLKVSCVMHRITRHEHSSSNSRRSSWGSSFLALKKGCSWTKAM